MTKRNYLYILVAIAAVFILCYFLQIGFVTSFGNQLAGFIPNPHIAGAALVLSFALLKVKFYVWIMVVCAIATAYLESRYVSSGVGNTILLAAKSAAFLSISFVLNFIRVLITK